MNTSVSRDKIILFTVAIVLLLACIAYLWVMNAEWNDGKCDKCGVADSTVCKSGQEELCFECIIEYYGDMQNFIPYG